MEKIPQSQLERFKHFDVLASVDLLRFDLTTSGEIQLETWQRVHDEELSYVAEGINRPLYTEFVLQEKDGQPVYFSEGQWQPYIGLLHKGLESAKQEAAQDSRKSLLVDMAARDLQVGYHMQTMKPGETFAWYSSFPDKENLAYGDTFIKSLGFQPERRLGFLHQLERNEDGSITMRTQSVDNSDELAFQAAMRASDDGQSFGGIVTAYDTSLEHRTGREHRAGRPKEQNLPEENAWDAIRQHRDLITYYFERLQTLASRDDLSRSEAESQKKNLTYGFWAALKERLDAAVTGFGHMPESGPSSPLSLELEVTAAYRKLQLKGEVLLGCGGILTAEEVLQNVSSEDVFDVIFGKKEGEGTSSDTMYCVHCPECKTFHEKVKKVAGKYHCKNDKCKLH